MASSPLVSLELLFRLSKLFVVVWFVVEILVFVWKAEVLPYPNGTLAAEIVLVIISAILEFLRISFGRRGNLTQEKRFLVASILVSLPSAIAFLYLFLWQTYVLRIEFGFCIAAFVLNGLAFLLNIAAIVIFSQGKYKRN
eukprot:m.25354 g.25354  ORF g.25354 m.25354 type:complete len:140 (-) comp5756_c0_seq1:206-625(-)